MTKRKLVTTSIATLIVIGGLSLGALHFLSQVNNAPPQATKYADRTTSPTGSSGSLSTDNRSHSDTNSTNDNQQPSKPNQNTDDKPTPAENNWVTQTMRQNQAQAANKQPEHRDSRGSSVQNNDQSTHNNSSNNNSSSKRRKRSAPSQPQPSDPGGSANHGQNQATIDGWQIDYFEGFDSSIKQTKWVQYGWGDPAVGHGCMGVM